MVRFTLNQNWKYGQVPFGKPRKQIMTQAQINHNVRHLERRILRLQKQADRAYKRNHNIIAVDFLNRAYWCERKLEYWKGIKL